jgi:DNA-binding CsgD family transcriptional regulator
MMQIDETDNTEQLAEATDTEQQDPRHQHYLAGMDKRRANPNYHENLSKSSRERWMHEETRPNVMKGRDEEYQQRRKQALAQTWTSEKRSQHGKEQSERRQQYRLDQTVHETPEERAELVRIAETVLDFREMEILRMLYNNKTPQEIADFLHYKTPQTVYNKTAQIRRKLAEARKQLQATQTPIQ